MAYFYFFKIRWNGWYFRYHSFDLDAIIIDIVRQYDFYLISFLILKKLQNRIKCMILIFLIIRGLFPTQQSFELQGNIQGINRFDDNRQAMPIGFIFGLSNLIIILILFLIPNHNNHIFLTFQIFQQLLRFIIKYFIHI